MAGGKETPRQKMIGMMYLVLTALLALNVSTTVIEKFIFINESLERANGETKERIETTIKQMTANVTDKGNREKDVVVLEAAHELRKQSQVLFDSMEAYKEAFIEITGGYLEGHDGDRIHLAGKTDYDKVGNYMMPIEENGKGHGERFEKLLDDQVDYIKDLLKKNGATPEQLARYNYITLDASEDEVYKNDPNQEGKGFSQLAFESSPTPAGLATVSEFQAQMLNMETAALDFLVSRVGLGDLSFDNIVPMVNPESKYVAAGTKYEAKMFVAASASGAKPEMKYNGTAIQVSDDGQGQVSFTATPGQYNSEGIARKTFKAEIIYGEDQKFETDIEYFVIKPVIDIQSQSVNALYLNCGNKLNVKVQALGNAYNPKFSVTGGDHIAGAEKGQVTVIPKRLGKVTLSVASGGNPIGSREFGVRGIPAPNLVSGTDRGEVDLKQGISAKTQRLFLRAVADKSFAEFLPDDAQFQVAQAEVTLVSGGIGRKVVRGGGRIDLRQIAAQARKGDQLVIEIKKVQRKNFRGEVEDFPISKSASFISIPLK
ncbi:MAG: gliding motility protein GldM [Cytophagales bacterium]|nr:gliding motility protein GldM [Cytophagales bacterium]